MPRWSSEYEPSQELEIPYMNLYKTSVTPVGYLAVSFIICCTSLHTVNFLHFYLCRRIWPVGIYVQKNEFN
jgi:hypothetical protein